MDHQAVAELWEAERDGPDEDFTMTSRVLAVDGATALTVGLAREPEAYPVMVRVSGGLDDVMVGRIETLIAVFSDIREHY